MMFSFQKSISRSERPFPPKRVSVTEPDAAGLDCAAGIAVAVAACEAVFLDGAGVAALAAVEPDVEAFVVGVAGALPPQEAANGIIAAARAPRIPRVKKS